MPYKKFEQNDKFNNVVRTYPKVRFDIYDSKLYYQNKSQISGAFTGSTPNVDTGFISLYELNVDRNESQTGLIYPFITKQGTLSSFKTISTSEFNNDFVYGATISGSYPLSSSISREYFPAGFIFRPHIQALKNTLNFYTNLSEHYAYSSSLGDKATQEMNLISIPSIFYGSSIKKGSVDLKFYISGSLIGELQDYNQNGELIQVGPSGSTGSGSVAGVVLYNEGFILLTGSWGLEDGIARNYLDDLTNLQTSSWINYAVGANDGIPSGIIPSSSYNMEFNGTNYIPTLTLLAHANRGEFNHSNNPTYVTSGSPKSYQTGSMSVVGPSLPIKNVVSSSYPDPTGSFEKTTYITKVGIYDENRNLIGIASVAKPIKKIADRNLTFKLKLDF
jgi:hypothetical protein